MNLHTSIREGGRAYKMYAGRLEKLEIFTFQDLLYHLPFRYDNFALISNIADVQPGEIVTLRGTVLEIKNSYIQKFRTMQKAKIGDETGTIEVTWFNQPFLTKYIQQHDKISLSGKVEQFAKKVVMQSPEYELINNSLNDPDKEVVTIHTGRLVPVYPETKGVTSKWLRRQIYKLLHDTKEQIVDFLPENLLERNNFLPLYNALQRVHFPDSFEEAQAARKRLAFNELFLLQLESLQRKEEWKKHVVGKRLSVTNYKSDIEKFITSLPFSLTGAQERAIEDIMQDLSSKKPMNRLLQGDVGSGKTVVSAVAIYLAYLNGYQSALMAPTEILAEQHYKTINTFLSSFGLTTELITGSKKPKLHEKKFDVLVGTHALLSEKITFDNLGIVIIDEQQRFGVEQRGIIRGKGQNPHLLTMTATPIPRTVALTMYGDLDLSYLNEMPKGRKIIKTWLVPLEKRNNAYDWIRKEINGQKSQIFIICPFIEESENMQTVKAATVEYDTLRKDIFPDLQLGLLHGKQKAKEKDAILQKFREKQFDILVATPVVEVGIDIPNATVILIEGSERFGLAGLHQLRGRVGRGNKQSYCLLFTESKNPVTIERLKAMEKSNIGAELAELDLRLRGPGELYGTRQSGVKHLKVASFSDFDLIEKARDEAKIVFTDRINIPELQKILQSNTGKTVSPD